MSIEDNKAIVGRWFAEFWGPDYNPAIIDELAAPEIRFEYSLHAPCRGRDEVRAFATKFRAAFPDLAFGGTSELIAEGDYVVGQWKGGGTHTGEAFDDMPIGSLPAGSGKTMRFTGTSVLKVENGLITEEVGLDDGVTALKMLGLVPQNVYVRTRQIAPVALVLVLTVAGFVGARLLGEREARRDSERRAEVAAAQDHCASHFDASRRARDNLR